MHSVRIPQLAFLTSPIDHNIDGETRDVIEKAGSHLYGLLHARYILSQRGLLKMVLIPIALPADDT
jgi:casein kinase II subunit beta